jgi:multidrug efflux pump subunit AcrA (membrane-fusion protein)
MTDVEVRPDGEFRERALGGTRSSLEQLDRLFRLTARRTWTAVVALAILVGALVVWGFVAERDVTVTAPGLLVPTDGFVEVARLESGVVDEVFVDEGDRVRTGDVMASYLAPGNVRAEILAPVDGRVAEVDVAAGSTLVPGLPSFTIVPLDAKTLAVAFASPATQSQIEEGMEVTLQAASAPPAQYGSIRGRIVDISDIPASLARLDRLTGGNQELAKAFLAGGPVYEVEVRLERDRDTVSGYRWTTDEGPDYAVPAGTIVQMTAVTDSATIASELLG